MHDLDELRRRLWLAVLVGAVGCDTSEAEPTDRSKSVAQDAQESKDKEPQGEPGPTTTAGVPGGMSALVDGAVADALAAAKEKKKIAAQDKAAFATVTCTEVIDRAAAVKDAGTTRGLEHGCPQFAASSMRLEVAETAVLRNAGDEDSCCYAKIQRAVRGRPYTVDGVPRLPGFHVRPTAEPLTLNSRERRRLAAGWLHDAREELASVAAFERAALELAQVGAPRTLTDACAVAAAQEHRHAALCLSIAEEFAARSLRLGSPLAAEPRRLSLLALLIETFEAGSAGETIAAAIAMRSARGASNRIRPTLLEIADDETEHAALAWRTLAWGVPRLTVRERGIFFASANAGRIDAPTTSAPSDAAAELNPEHGRMTPAMQARVAADVWQQVITPLLRELQRQPAQPSWAPHRQTPDSRATN